MRRRAVLLAGLALLALHGRTAEAATPEWRKVAEVELVDANGARHRFPAEIAAGRLVVLNPIWTGCSSICPLTSAILGELGERLGARLGRDVQLLSLAIDPIRLPEDQLGRWQADYGQVAGWSWLGGEPAEIDRLLRGLAIPVDGALDQHPAVFLVLDPTSGATLRFNGMPDSADLLAALDQLGQGR